MNIETHVVFDEKIVNAATTSAPQSTRLFGLRIRIQRPLSIPWASTTR